MHRKLYVLVYPSRLFAAHWSFWLPYPGPDAARDADTGDRVHVTGDRLTGFAYEYLRDYSVRDDDRHPNAFPIGLLSETHVHVSKAEEEHGDGDQVTVAAAGAVSALDEACRAVPAPGPSLNKVKPGGGGGAEGAPRGPPKRAVVRDCQWWIKEVTAHLVKTGILLPLGEGQEGESPNTRVEGLPRH
ncbi:hypothetical protein F5Y15DRAFT_295478 [Xylariaceae sp. FL0016]|nr:hypothetical protein F5Y15DRAFT_295478 [Xylariaceae sp. FL0016]